MDSTKIEVTIQSFDKLINELSGSKSDSIWRILIPLLIGAALTFLAQWSIERLRSSKERNLKKEELISKGKAKEYLISQILKELAMYKALKQYYAAAMSLSIMKEDVNDAHRKHYEKGQELRVTESKLTEAIAEYFQIISEYEIITKRRDCFKNYLDEIVAFKHPKSYEYDGFSNSHDLKSFHDKEENRLNGEYNKLRNILSQIQRLM